MNPRMGQVPVCLPTSLRWEGLWCCERTMKEYQLAALLSDQQETVILSFSPETYASQMLVAASPTEAVAARRKTRPRWAVVVRTIIIRKSRALIGGTRPNLRPDIDLDQSSGLGAAIPQKTSLKGESAIIVLLTG
ncbi:hypothetical protein, variant 4 [Cladophialophora immunda]|uniref:Uncharacterized protein n=1 Tax=Cladophialophora immunda TaxID=569365 RepID=A0A0D2AKH4_9EURO|nr:uncharacterized protein PV07_08630 [Cladophialophora immunda]XP_016245676.1 hypothetical protein, variant 1 [Cladophialophora immunda]XP_016245677.1 hypothetical protein, variant 2 [Cladophialophora immunda]XP_016245678.1 hypothetical protein, variant 3 [Cladophialophora immunda]XP_016245679.1 hypothetical protein, variant 4 [Cladophialophora immunda]KIW25459.1 hypothetical protein PV07_08630 [Cladophialophora immunda]KIW25460.1 hypothetical protein, variant 1 [Cladophialophora immunda]KI